MPCGSRGEIGPAEACSDARPVQRASEANELLVLAVPLVDWRVGIAHSAVYRLPVILSAWRAVSVGKKKSPVRWTRPAWWRRQVASIASLRLSIMRARRGLDHARSPSDNAIESNRRRRPGRAVTPMHPCLVSGCG